jgi:hypothetical protein
VDGCSCNNLSHCTGSLVRRGGGAWGKTRVSYKVTGPPTENTTGNLRITIHMDVAFDPGDPDNRRF